MKYEIKNCSGGDAGFIRDSLVAYNISRVPAEQNELFIPVEKKIVDGGGNIIAGCLAVIYCWNVIFIDILWVDEAYRGQELGSALLLDAEREAAEKGCRLAHLDTYDFQARGFYEKHGYTVFGTLEECPKGHCRYFLSKPL
ncbi:MAG: GNAT family N-acetyltransferase [Oscillospiraceae bacterium]|nr:GNAT family N-acetyltransferase [Oscillospiraceae bacterium]